jgi:hypothetical protein
MKTINNRRQLLSFVETNFDYLIPKGFQMVDVEMPDSQSWAVIFEGKCQIRVEWNWHDGPYVMVSESAKAEHKNPIGYDSDILIYYLMGRTILEQHYDDPNLDGSLNSIKLKAQFLRMYLDEIVEFVSSGRLRKEVHQVKQARQALIEWELQRIEEEKD